MATVPASVPRSAGLAASTLGIARRGLLKFARTPQLVVVGTIQSALFLLIFRYVFGGAIATGGLDYVDFLVPGFITTGVLVAGMAEDLQQGFVDRLRSLPMPRGAVLAGRALADTALLVWSLAVTAAVGFAVGFRLHGGAADALAAFGLLLVFGFAFEWMFITLGLVAGTPQAAQGLALMVFPLTFVSSAYVPVESMPGWMQAFAEHQPLTVMVDAIRVLTQGPAGQAGPGPVCQPSGPVGLVVARLPGPVLGPLEQPGQLDQGVGVGGEVVPQAAGVGGRGLRPPPADAGVAGPAGQLGVGLGHGVAGPAAGPPPGEQVPAPFDPRDQGHQQDHGHPGPDQRPLQQPPPGLASGQRVGLGRRVGLGGERAGGREIGRASCRERV